MVKNKSGDGNRKWGFLLGGLGVVILGLVIGIVVVLSKGRLVLNTCEEAVNYMFQNSNIDDLQTLIDAGNRALEVAPNDEVKGCIYSNRFGALYNNIGQNGEYIAQMMSDAYAAEEIKQDASSAYNIYIAETMLGNIDKADEWMKVAEKRGIGNRTGRG